MANEEIDVLWQINYKGVCFANGEFGPIDNRLALKYYLKAACAGYVESLWNAGSMLIEGEELVEAEPALGMLLIRMAADRFQTSACLYISRCYELGRFGLPLNPDLTKYWTCAAYKIERFEPVSDAAELELVRSYPLVKQFLSLADS
ncbi:sel1 repeat family protein [Comamonadaceae bacterium OH2310_COT-174]|nr:sel1 repeat family protein [Comamonadaceae bacterium OH2310_COT-174]